YYTDGSQHNHGFLYSGGIYTTLDVPMAVTTAAWGINNAGQIVGAYVTGPVDHSFLYSGGTYTIIDHPVGTNDAFGINNAGQIVGIYGGVSYLYNGGIYTTLDDPLADHTIPGGVTWAQDINDGDQIVGYYTNA